MSLKRVTSTASFFLRDSSSYFVLTVIQTPREYQREDAFNLRLPDLHLPPTLHPQLSRFVWISGLITGVFGALENIISCSHMQIGLIVTVVMVVNLIAQSLLITLMDRCFI